MSGSTVADIEFHRWLATAIKRNLGAMAADEYYRDRSSDEFVPYSVTVDGDRVRFPLYTTDGWRDYDGTLEEIATHADGTAPSVTHDGVLDELARQLAHRDGTDIRKHDVDVRDHLWDGTVYTPISGATDRPRFEMQETNYFTHLSTSERLAWEVYESLYEDDIPADAGRSDIRRDWEPSLPYRQQVAASIAEGVGGGGVQPLFGVTAMVAINDGSGYQVPFLLRDSQLAASPCQYGLTGGVYDPMSSGLRDQLLREVVEELLGGEEGESATAHSIGQRLIGALDDGRASIDYLQTVIDPKWMNHHVRLLFVIDDSELGRTMLNNHVSNFEAEHVEFIDVTTNANWIRRMASVETLSPMAAPCVFDGVLRLSAEYGADCPINVSVETD